MERVTKAYTKDEVMALMEPLVAEWFSRKFEGLTEPQSYAIPLIHERQSVLVSSPTGSGKTLTAFLSIINELFKYAKEGKLEDRVYAVYISPLKALANDINRNLEEPLREMRALAEAKGIPFPEIRVGVRSGDTSAYERQRMVRKPPHIFITTPESLALVLAAPKFRGSFSKVEYVIVDEVHEVCDSKRGVFLSLTLERLQAYCTREFVRVGLSATLAPVGEIAAFLVGLENGAPRAVKIAEVRSRKDLDLKVLCPAEDMTVLPYEIVNSKMYDMLREMIEEHRTTLVFTNTRSGTESVVYKLKERGVESIEAHHGSLSKETRLGVEERLKRGELRCVVSSTSLELGIDIGSIDLVCQVGSPKSVAKGLQRFGRSGHSYGRTSKGRMIVFDNDDLVECAVLSRAAHKNRIDRVTIPENCLDVLAQSIVGMSIENRWSVEEALRLVRRSYCYRQLPEESFLDVLRYLGSKDAFEGVYSKIWYDEGEGRFGRKRGARMIYFLNLGTIPEEASYKVFSERGGQVGDLSEKFVERLSPRDIFVLGGRTYEHVRTRGMRVFVRTATGKKPTVPSWTGEMLPRSFDLSMEVAKFRREMCERLGESDDAVLSWLVKGFDLDEGSARSILSYFWEQRTACGIIPTDRALLVEGYRDVAGNHSVIFHFPFGQRVNDALSRAYAFQLTQQLGRNLSVSVTDDGFMITSPRKVELKGIERIVSASNLEGVLRKAVKDSEIFKQRFRHTAARSFMILRNYKGREISVNRQQVRSGYLLDSLGEMERVPVVEETYREILNDVMDLENARGVLESIESGRIATGILDYSSIPSPFAHGVLLAGISDIVLMEDRSSLLKELHRRILSKVMASEISEFEFEAEKVSAYFRKKLGTIGRKEDIVAMLKLAGPMRAFKERSRSLYPYSSQDRKTLDGWVEELLEEGKVASVFIDDAFFVASEDLPVYATVLRKERTMGEEERKALNLLSEERTQAEIGRMLGLEKERAGRVLRSLELAHLIGRVARRGGHWHFRRREVPEQHIGEALDVAVSKFLASTGPSTVEEIAFALGLKEAEVKEAVSGLVKEGALAEGKFVVSERTQYMLRRDYLRLKSDDLKAYDSRTVESYRRRKLNGPFGSIEECLSFLGGAGDPLDVFRRVPGFSMKDWNELRRDGTILLGRFQRGRVRYILARDAPMFVSIYREPIARALEAEMMDLLRRHEALSLRELSSLLSMPKERVRESLGRLDRSIRVVRRFEEREALSRENVYAPFDPAPFEGDARRELIRRFIRTYGPVPLQGIIGYTGFLPWEVHEAMEGLDIVRISVGGGRTDMFLMADELEDLEFPVSNGRETRILSLYDPEVQPLWSEVSSRYGDRWIYPILRDGTLVGAAEKWNMSGCIEIRALDLDDMGLLPDALRALDEMMAYYNQLGYDVIRIREIGGVAVDQLPAGVAAQLTQEGYRLIGTSMVKGNVVPIAFPWEKALALILFRQAIPSEMRYEDILEGAKATGGFRSDPGASLRCRVSVPLKKLFEQGTLVRMQAVPEFITYTTVQHASLYRKVKGGARTEDMNLLLRVLEDKSPISKGELFDLSPVGHKRTSEALKALYLAAHVYVDRSRKIALVPDNGMSVQEARVELLRVMFRNYGIFSAENLSRFLKFELTMGEIRECLASLEREGFLVKGYFIKGDDTLHWMLKDLEAANEEFEEGFVLTRDDNLHFYLQPWLKAQIGFPANVIFKGTRIVGSFRAGHRGKDLYLVEFNGDQEARRIFNDYLRANGLTLRRKKDEGIPDWEIEEFYEKTHPGEA